jgi:hypothetical protein
MTETYLRDVMYLPESVHAGDFKVELSGGIRRGRHHRALDEYVVTEQLRRGFGNALSVVRSAVRYGVRTPHTCTGRSDPARATS